MINANSFGIGQPAAAERIQWSQRPFGQPARQSNLCSLKVLFLGHGQVQIVILSV